MVRVFLDDILQGRDTPLLGINKEKVNAGNGKIEKHKERKGLGKPSAIESEIHPLHKLPFMQ